jgi:hypothetical protein
LQPILYAAHVTGPVVTIVPDRCRQAQRQQDPHLVEREGRSPRFDQALHRPLRLYDHEVLGRAGSAIQFEASFAVGCGACQFAVAEGAAAHQSDGGTR